MTKPTPPPAPPELEPFVFESYMETDFKSNPGYWQLFWTKRGLPDIEARVQYLLKEEEFVPVTEPSPLVAITSDPMQQAIGLGIQKCLICEETGSVAKPHVGKVTGLRIDRSVPCTCLKYKLFYPQWVQYVPANYRECTPRNFENREFRTGRLPNAGMWGRIKECLDTEGNNNFGALLVGEAACGKTSVMYMLLHRTLERWADEMLGKGIRTPRAVWAVHAFQLAQEQRDYARGSQTDNPDAPLPPPPTIHGPYLDSAIRAGLKPAIFIDELDKYSSTDFQNSNFHSIVDKATSSGGIAVATSNLRLSSLEARLGAQHGAALLRRFASVNYGYLFDFFGQQVTRMKVGSPATSYPSPSPTPATTPGRTVLPRKKSWQPVPGTPKFRKGPEQVPPPASATGESQQEVPTTAGYRPDMAVGKG